MARNRVVIETITCDICGKEVESAVTKRLVNDRTDWELDLCEDDAAKVNAQIGEWTKNARRGTQRKPARAANDDWEYLESLGFKRHRGRKTPAENAALANR